MSRQPWIVIAFAGLAACGSPPSAGETPSGLDDHHIPASRIPGPPHATWSPPAHSAPPNPIANRQPMHNPGGVNGDRPARTAPRLESATTARELKTLDVPPASTRH